MRAPSSEAIAAARGAQHFFPVVLASISLAQWAIESAWGTKMTGVNNPFGIKAVIGQAFTSCATHEEINGRLVPTLARFANYTSLDQAFMAHARLLATRPQYEAYQKASGPEAQCMALSGVYATDPLYGQKLWGLIQEERFAAYDL